MKKYCKKCAVEFEITDDDLEFYDRVSPVFGGKKYIVPPPKLCPDCRQQRRLVQRNQNKLYKRKCDFSGEEMISLYSADKTFKVYKENIWWSDKWDPLDFGRDFDFSRPFFEQFAELQADVPRRGMHQDGTNENCEYTTFGMSNKDCYLSFGVFHCENAYYSHMSGMLKDCFDCLLSVQCELCYECTDCTNCYGCAFCQDCTSCQDSFLLQDCKNCHHCIGCKNLRNKEYHIYNKPVSKEEFEAYKAKLIEGGFKDEIQKFNKWKLSLPFVYARKNKCENSDGDYLDQAKNCHDCFDIILGAEDCRYCQFSGWNGKDMYDCTTSGKKTELIYEMMATTETYHCAFNNFCRFGLNIFYSSMLGNCKNCFGCIGLNYKEYCILNKQYTKEEYEEVVPKIIEHIMATHEWGEFFPASLSPFSYNETMAIEVFPLSKEEALKAGFAWKDEEDKSFAKATFEAPSSINKVDDSVLNEVLACKKCGKNYRIIQQELELHKKMEVPLPSHCFECRYWARLALRNPRKLWDRKCDKCGTAIKTSYSPERPEKVYCEECYLKEVY